MRTPQAAPRGRQKALEDATRNQTTVSLIYKGCRRYFCPVIMGTKGGEMRVLGYQIGGSSNTGLPEPEWRCLVVSGCTLVTDTKLPFRMGTSHKKPQTCIDSITVQGPR